MTKHFRFFMVGFLAVVNSWSVQAQKYLYPIKKDHRWGYINSRGVEIIEPVYDFIAHKDLVYHREGNKTERSGFRLVKLDNHLGLKDQNRMDVLRPMYKRIRPLTQQYFAVKKEGEAFSVVEKGGQEVVPPGYDNIFFLDTLDVNGKAYFKVSNNRRWGVHQGNGSLVLPMSYHDVQLVAGCQGCFKVKKTESSQWGLVKDGQSVLDYKFHQIRGLHHDFIALKTSAEAYTWSVVTAEGQPVLNAEWRRIKKLNEDWAILTLDHPVDTLGYLYALEKGGFFAFWDTTIISEKRLEVNPSDYPQITEQRLTRQEPFAVVNTHQQVRKRIIQDSSWSAEEEALVLQTLELKPRRFVFESLDDRHIRFKARGLYGLLNGEGQVVLPANYEEIVPYGDSSYAVRQNFFWGIFHQRRKMVKKCTYFTLRPEGTKLGKFRLDRGVGVINQYFEEIIAPVHDSIVIDSNLVKGHSGRNLTVYELDMNTGQVIDYTLYSNVIQLNFKSDAGDFREAEVIRGYRYSNRETDFVSEFRSPDRIDGSVWQWRQHPKEKTWKFRDLPRLIKGQLPDSNQIFRNVYHIGEPRMTLLYPRGRSVAVSVTQLGILPREVLMPLAIFDHRKGQLITDYDLLGIRRHDFERQLPYAATIDHDGYFGLIDRNGKPKLDGLSGHPIRFTFIGEFIDGMARVCRGGKLVRNKAVSKEKFSVGGLALFWKKFCLVPAQGNLEGMKHRLGQSMIVVSDGDSEPTWGFIDTLGNWVASTRFDFARDLVDGQSVVVRNGRWGIWDAVADSMLVDFEFAHISDYYGNWKVNYPNKGIILFDRKGWELSSFEYKSIEPFKEGFSRVLADSTNRWGIIDTLGQVVIPCSYLEIRDFSEGLAAVRSDSQWFFIDTTGSVALDLQAIGWSVSTVGSFSEGLCWFRSGKFVGYLDRRGNVVIPPDRYVNGLDFENGIARVVAANRKTGLVDKEGKEILSPSAFEVIRDFNEYGVAKVARRATVKKFELIDRQGNVLTTAGKKYDFIGEFENGLALAKTGNRFGYLDTLGKVAVAFQFVAARSFSEGLAAVKLENRKGWIYIDGDGQKAFDGQFAVAKSYRNGFAEVQVRLNDLSTKMVLDSNGHAVHFERGTFQFYHEGIFGMHDKDSPVRKHPFYYADKKGNNLFDLYFEKIEPFYQGFAYAEQNSRKVILDKLGMFALRPKYRAVELLGDGYSLVRPPAFGIISRTGEELLPPEFDFVTVLSGNILKAEKGEQIGYMNARGQWIWSMQK